MAIGQWQVVDEVASAEVVNGGGGERRGREKEGGVGVEGGKGGVGRKGRREGRGVGKEGG